MPINNDFYMFQYSDSFAQLSLLYENKPITWKLTNTLQMQTFFIVMFGGFVSEHVFLPTLSRATLGISTEKVSFHF